MTTLGLGIDAGGTQTRWALADAEGPIVAEGHVAGMSALQMHSDAGRDVMHSVFAEMAQAVLACGQPTRVCAGLTGWGSDNTLPAQWLSELLGITPDRVTMSNDVEIAYLDSFTPGAGYLVYAGTGSIAAYIDEHGAFHRAGGRGVGLDDGGGGYWIAREALRHIWRREDEQPGAWRDSPMAQAVFDYVGGSEWDRSRQFMYGSERGAIGKLALAVAASAEQDPAARTILQQAGRELARIAMALVSRYGVRPVALSGRAADLHPLIETAMRDTLAPNVPMHRHAAQPHYAAARLAARPQN
ncbi:BadF/BadG/BcrA/BcrD ATPase family protein [Pseudoduganella ginsengisoli]|uniref:ATPase n=1 Tax=Pseudoduganella ginsengisoli TaxID=1462440 RepID=A0A6L6Q1S0_9BURK|nr:BadF/BadG/BcrA/BcrD ATPase family protein [Pseudoduganella ginsengisoli]MTW02992.1 ATPase [Pseudoduganella ginsengisoli]